MDKIVAESDCIKGGTCMECFHTGGKKFFYNSAGPFCNLDCYALFHGVLREDLPMIDYRGKLSD